MCHRYNTLLSSCCCLVSYYLQALLVQPEHVTQIQLRKRRFLKCILTKLELSRKSLQWNIVNHLEIKPIYRMHEYVNCVKSTVFTI